MSALAFRPHDRDAPQGTIDAPGAKAYAVLDLGDGTVNIINTNANKCLDVYGAGTGNGNKIDLWDCNGTVAQTWVLRPAQNGFANIVNPNSGKPPAKPASTPHPEKEHEGERDK